MFLELVHYYRQWRTGVKILLRIRSLRGPSTPVLPSLPLLLPFPSLSCPPIPLPAEKRRLQIQLGSLRNAVSSSRLHKMVKHVN